MAQSKYFDVVFEDQSVQNSLGYAYTVFYIKTGSLDCNGENFTFAVLWDLFNDSNVTRLLIANALDQLYEKKIDFTSFLFLQARGNTLELIFDKNKDYLSPLPQSIEIPQEIFQFRWPFGIKIRKKSLSDVFFEKSLLAEKDQVERDIDNLIRNVTLMNFTAKQLILPSDAGIPSEEFLLIAKLRDSFEHMEEVYNHPNYSTLLDRFKENSKKSEFFQFNAISLLNLSIEEYKLSGVKTVAVGVLAGLFKNLNLLSELELEEHRRFLEKFIKVSTDPSGYWKNYIVMYILYHSLNSAKSIQNPTELLEKHISFCVRTLFRYAEVETDSNPYEEGARNYFYLLLKACWASNNSGAQQFLFAFLSLYLKADYGWELLDKLKTVDKIDTDNFLASSAVKKREFITGQFTLSLSSKRNGNECIIGEDVDVISGLKLHERLSLTESLIFSEKNNIHDISQSKYGKNFTYLVVNLGFVSRTLHADGQQRLPRFFYTMPIIVGNDTITGLSKPVLHGHAEEAFYDYLLKDANLNKHLNEFKNRFNLLGQTKIYAIILDFHGTYDMCLSCSAEGKKFQDNFRQKMLQIFPSHQLVTLKKHPSQIPVVMRYSSNFSYHYPPYNNPKDEEKLKGTLTTVTQLGITRDISLSSQANDASYSIKRDIKYHDANLLVHGKWNWHLLWGRAKCKTYEDRVLPLEKRTAFTTCNKMNSLTDQLRLFSYTRPNGTVDTIDPYKVDVVIDKLPGLVVNSPKK